MHLPTATLTVNLVGALLLGALTGFLAAMGPDRGGLGLVRLAAGTGLMGGLTTHSTYILEVARMLQHDRKVPALAYLLGSLAAGLAPAVLSGSGEADGAGAEEPDFSGDALAPKGHRDVNSQVPRVIQDQAVKPRARIRIPARITRPIRFSLPRKSGLAARAGTISSGVPSARTSSAVLPKARAAV